MVRRKTHQNDRDGIDTMLRQASRPHARALSRILFGVTQSIKDPTWVETQVAARQRRVDRALSVRIGNKYRWQHIEWTEAFDGDIPARVYEYNHMLAMAAQADADAASKPGKPPVKPATIDSVVVVLTGPKHGFPKVGVYQTSSKDEPFSGVHFRIEAVYLRTVAEIEAMRSVFWLVFIPLAVDADEPAIVRAINTMRSRTNPRDFGDLMATMFTIARMKKDRPSFMDVVRSQKPRDTMIKNNWLIQGRREGRKEGVTKGRKALLLSQVQRRLGRPMTPDERTQFTAQLNQEDGAERLANAVVDLSADELAALLVSKTPSKRRQRAA